MAFHVGVRVGSSEEATAAVVSTGPTARAARTARPAQRPIRRVRSVLRVLPVLRVIRLVPMVFSCVRVPVVRHVTQHRAAQLWAGDGRLRPGCRPINAVPHVRLEERLGR